MDGGLFGHVRTAHAHRHADVGLAKRRRIIHPVAQHRHDFAARLQPPNQHQLVFGCNAAESRHVIRGRR